MEKNEFVYATDANGNDQYPLSIIQYGLWAMNTLGLAKDKFRNLLCGQCVHLYNGFEFDRDRMERAVQKLYDGDDALRMVLTRKGIKITQRVVSNYRYKIDIRETSGATAEERYQNALALASAEVDKPLMGVNQIMSRIIFFRIDKDDYLIYLSLAHIVGDGMSGMCMVKKLLNYYFDASFENQSKPFSEFITFERKLAKSNEAEKYNTYWEEKLKGYKRFQHKSDGMEGEGNGTLSLSYPKDVVQKKARQYRTGDFALYLAAIHYAISRYYKVADTVIMTTAANRRQEQFRTTVGYLCRAISSRFLILPEETFDEMTARLVREYQEDLVYQELPKMSYITNIFCTRMRDTSVMRSIPAYHGKIEFPDIHADRSLCLPKFIGVLINDVGDDTVLTFTYQRKYFSDQCIQTIYSYAKTYMDTLLNEPEKKIGNIFKE